MILDFRFKFPLHKAHAYSVIYDCRLSNSNTLITVNKVPHGSPWTLQTLWTL